MASTTTNLGLTKPAYTDSADVAVINSNMDILDTKIGAIGNTSVASQIGTLSEQIVALQGKITDASKGTIDLNDYKSTGMYSYNGNTSSNTPSTGSCTLIVQKYSNDFVVQIVSIVRSTVTEMWVRNFYNGTTWSDWSRLAMKSEVTSFSAIGASSGSSGNVEIQLPSNAMFSSSHPLFMITSFRGSTSNVNEGFAVIKIDNNVPYITNKTGIQTLSNLAYNSSTKKLTFTTGTYITCLVFGFVLT